MTVSNQIQQWLQEVGNNQPNIQWLLSPYDTWERNPYYTGPEQNHPEDDDYLHLLDDE